MICREVFEEIMQTGTPIPPVVQKETMQETNDDSDVDLSIISDTLMGFRKK